MELAGLGLFRGVQAQHPRFERLRGLVCKQGFGCVALRHQHPVTDHDFLHAGYQIQSGRYPLFTAADGIAGQTAPTCPAGGSEQLGLHTQYLAGIWVLQRPDLAEYAQPLPALGRRLAGEVRAHSVDPVARAEQHPPLRTADEAGRAVHLGIAEHQRVVQRGGQALECLRGRVLCRYGRAAHGRSQFDGGYIGCGPGLILRLAPRAGQPERRNQGPVPQGAMAMAGRQRQCGRTAHVA